MRRGNVRCSAGRCSARIDSRGQRIDAGSAARGNGSGARFVRSDGGGIGEKIYLHPEAVITNADVTVTHVISGDRPGTFNVGIMFSADGSAKMQKATQAHLNKPLAILVNGHLVSAPTLRSQIRGSAVVTGDFTNAEASALAASLNGQ